MKNELKKEPKRIAEPSFREAEYQRLIYQAIIPADVTLQEILEPSYWGWVARLLKPFCKIECCWSDNSKYADLLVTFADKISAVVKAINYVDFTKENESEKKKVSAFQGIEKDGYKVHFAGGDKWRIVRLEDNVVVKKGMDSLDTGLLELQNYLTSLNN